VRAPRITALVCVLCALFACRSRPRPAPEPLPTIVPPAGDGGPRSLCDPGACARPAARGTLEDRALDEVSGLVASAIHRNIWYVHNDSGDRPRFFALEGSGVLRGTYALAGAQADDWEDLARGPCASAGSCLYLADIGDNRERRASYTIYRVAEPASFGPGEREVPAEALPFRYPDGSHNAETILVHPATGVVTIVTKVASGASGIYELPMPLTPGVMATAVRRGTIAPPSGSPRYTGGDVHPTMGVLLRTYSSVYRYAMGAGQSVAEALAGAPCVLPAPPEMQGEAIAWLPRGEGYMTISEGIGATVFEVRCEGTP
jgi:hypothetical protein